MTAMQVILRSILRYIIPVWSLGSFDQVVSEKISLDLRNEIREPLVASMLVDRPGQYKQCS